MTETTATLDLPYIMPSQAQKHVTHNEALQKLDAAVQLVVTDILGTPPSNSSEGTCYLVSPEAGGEWAGKTGNLAVWQDEAWMYLKPKIGWLAWFAKEQRIKVLRQDGWAYLPLPDKAQCDQLGVGTTPDATNRLAVASAASLFTHDSNGSHQVKVNKAGASHTASLLFQSGWSGRAEMGLAGNDGFSIKTSVDGANWQTALAISGRGLVTTPLRPVVRAGRAAETVSPATGSVSGFSSLPVNQGGFLLGATLSGGTQELRVPSSGLYMVSLSLAIASSSGHTVTLRVNGTDTAMALNGTQTSADSLQSGSFIMALAEDDRIVLSHKGTCQLIHGPGKTELSMTML